MKKGRIIKRASGLPVPIKDMTPEQLAEYKKIKNKEYRERKKEVAAKKRYMRLYYLTHKKEYAEYNEKYNKENRKADNPYSKKGRLNEIYEEQKINNMNDYTTGSLQRMSPDRLVLAINQIMRGDKIFGGVR